jgi:hypothetical protein
MTTGKRGYLHLSLQELLFRASLTGFRGEARLIVLCGFAFTTMEIPVNVRGPRLLPGVEP